MRLRTAVLASGRGSNFEALADASASRRWEVVLLVTDRAQAGAVERARGRGIPAEVVPVEPVPGSFGERLLAVLRAHRIELVLLAGFLRLVPAEVVRAFPNRILNLHPALLPAFGGPGMYGRRVHQAVLDAGARFSGATVHFVDEEYDRGEILAQWPVAVLPDDDAETLAARVLGVEHALYPAAVDALSGALVAGATPESVPSRARRLLVTSNLPSFP